jgi:tRNA(adenine34) deaminase
MNEDNQQRDTKSSDEYDDTYFMGLALEHAAEAQRLGEVPVGAIIVRNGQVIATGRNAPIGTNDPTSHAEIEAIRQATTAQGNYRLSGCTLYVTLEPCLMCAGAMTHARIERLVFGCSDPGAGAAGTLYNIPEDERLNHRLEVSRGVRSEESGQLLRQFFRQRRDTR